MQNTPSRSPKPPQPRLPPRQFIPTQPSAPANSRTKKRSKIIKFGSLFVLILGVIGSIASIIGYPFLGIPILLNLIYHSGQAIKVPPIGTTLYTYSSFKGAVDAIAWSPNGQFIVLGAITVQYKCRTYKQNIVLHIEDKRVG